MIGTGESRKDGGRAAFNKRLRCMSRRNLVECRIGNIDSSHRRHSIQDCLQRFQDLGITLAAVGLRIRLRRPEAVTNGFGKIGRDKGDFIQEALLLAQHWNYFVLHQSRKFRRSLRFKSNDYMTSKHAYAPLVLSYWGQMIWLIPEEPEKE